MAGLYVKPKRGSTSLGAAAARRSAGGIKLTGQTGINKNPASQPGSAPNVQTSSSAAARAGKRFKIGLDAEGRIVHLYSRADVGSGPTTITLKNSGPKASTNPPAMPLAGPPKGAAPLAPAPNPREMALAFIKSKTAQNAPPAKGQPAAAAPSTKSRAAKFSRKSRAS